MPATKTSPVVAPHKSHKMTRWENTIVTLIDTPRFGTFRKCKNCGAEQAQTVAGQAMHPELRIPCRAVVKRA